MTILTESRWLVESGSVNHSELVYEQLPDM